MIEDGCMKDPDTGAVIAFHVAPYLPAGAIEFCRGKMNAATCVSRWKWKGYHATAPIRKAG